MIWLIIGIILFVFSLVLHAMADKCDSEKPVQKEAVVQKETVIKSSFWDEFKKQNPVKAQELVDITHRDFERLDEKSAKEIIDAFEYVANRNKFSSYIPIKEYLLNLYIQVYEDCGLEECKQAINQNISDEVRATSHDSGNTIGYFSSIWFKEYLGKLPVSEKFRNELKDGIRQIMNEPEFSVGFFNDGCDTLACEVILKFYKHVSEDPGFKLQAAQRGYYDEFSEIVTDVIKWGLDKYCNVTLQEAEEYQKMKASGNMRWCPDCEKSVLTIIDGFGTRRCKICGKEIYD